jgi:hypothetical protein
MIKLLEIIHKYSSDIKNADYDKIIGNYIYMFSRQKKSLLAYRYQL